MCIFFRTPGFSEKTVFSAQENFGLLSYNTFLQKIIEIMHSKSFFLHMPLHHAGKSYRQPELFSVSGNLRKKLSLPVLLFG